MSPKVSVIIPAYNVENFISKAVISALEQTEQSLEVIIIDDSSKDQTVQVINRITDPRVKLLINQENLGASASRNRGIKAAQGEWIALLDSDDWYAPERLEKLLEVSRVKPDADLISDDIFYIKENEKYPWSTLLSESDEYISSVKKIDPIYFVEKDLPISRGLYLGLTKPLIRKDFLLTKNLEFDTSIKVCHDFWLYLNCLINQANFYFIPEPFYFYVSRDGALTTTNKSDQLDEFCDAAKVFMQDEKINSWPQLVNVLTERLNLIEHTLKPYYLVVDRLKKQEWWSALISVMKNPRVVVHFFDQFIPVVMRRVRYVNRRDETLSI